MSDREITTRILPYEDNSGYRFEVLGTWKSDAEKSLVTVKQHEDRIEITYAGWLALKEAIEEAFEFVARKTPT
jgi:hypothetical protein